MTDIEPQQLEIEAWLREQASNDFTCEAKLIEAAETIRSLDKAIKVQANAVKMIDSAWAKEINYHRERKGDYDIAISTLDSEREANKLLTAEIERMRSWFGCIVDTGTHKESCPEHVRCVEIARQALEGK